VEEILQAMVGRTLTSFDGTRRYTVAEVLPGIHVTITSETRQPSILAWQDIDRVFQGARNGIAIRPTVVDEILDNPQYRHSSTMSALVRAMSGQD
jgi:hypothetical protein